MKGKLQNGKGDKTSLKKKRRQNHKLNNRIYIPNYVCYALNYFGLVLSFFSPNYSL